MGDDCQQDKKAITLMHKWHEDTQILRTQNLYAFPQAHLSTTSCPGNTTTPQHPSPLQLLSGGLDVSY